jgi:molecular chaperone GrpE
MNMDNDEPMQEITEDGESPEQLEQEPTIPLESPSSPQEDQFEQYLLAMNEIKAILAALQADFESKLKYDASKERIIQNLHSEVQSYKGGLYFKIMQPIFYDLFAMHDDLTNLLRFNAANISPEEALHRFRKSMASFQESVESVLEHYGVTPFEEPGDDFVPQRQRAARLEPTDDPLKDRQVSNHIRKGFEYEGKVLRPEAVALYKYQEPKPEENSIQ